MVTYMMFLVVTFEMFFYNCACLMMATFEIIYCQVLRECMNDVARCPLFMTMSHILSYTIIMCFEFIQCIIQNTVLG